MEISSNLTGQIQMGNLSGIYEIVNTVNGKRYIGSAKNFKTRWNKHRSALRRDKHGNRHLQGAWNKHGEASFKFLPILTCQLSMLLKERQRLAAIKSNQTRAISAETREKMAAKKRGKVMHANTLALQTNRMKGNSLRLGTKWTPEMREKILASRAATNLRKKQGGAG